MNDDLNKPINTNGEPYTSKADTGADKMPGVPERHRFPRGTSGNTGVYRNDSAASTSNTAREDWNRRKALPPRERGTRSK